MMQDGRFQLTAAAALIPDGASVMFGGFMGVGSPDRIIDALVARGARGLTVIGNDTALPGVGVGKLIDAGCVARVKASHIGTNPMTQKKMIAGEIEVDLVPQGTLAERIRAGGSGLGGVLTPTGVGTVVEKASRSSRSTGASFLLELPIRADFALMRAHEADYHCNLTYRLTATNFNPLMAFAADCVIAEPDEIVPVGVIPPDAVRTPGMLVHHLVERPQLMDAKELIARRVALELRDRTLVNLGIGLPTLVARYVPAGISVAFQSENGIIGFGAPPPDGMEDPNLTDAGGGFISALPGRCEFRQRHEFCAHSRRPSRHDGSRRTASRRQAAVSPIGWCPANWSRAWAARWTSSSAPSASSSPCSTPPRVSRRSSRSLTLPPTATRRVSLDRHRMAVIEPTPEGLLLRERAPGVSVETIVASTGAKLLINGDVPTMPIAIRFERVAA